MVSLKVNVIPTPELSSSERNELAFLYARLLYTAEVTIQAEDSGSVDEIIEFPFSPRKPLDGDGKTQFHVHDYKEQSTIVVRIETPQGAILWSSGDIDHSGDVQVPKKIITDASARDYPDLSPVMERRGRFVHICDSEAGFTGYELYATAIEIGTPKYRAAKGFFKVKETNPLTDLTTWIKREDVSSSLLNILALQHGKVRPDGSFELAIEITSDEIGWLWFLMGEQIYAGFIVDGDVLKSSHGMLLTLPPSGEGNQSISNQPVGDLREGGISSSSKFDCCGPIAGTHTSSTLDFDETLMTSNPNLFSDDPGAYCKPFKNPQRILGERRFHTILRIEQPDIGGKPSIILKQPPGPVKVAGGPIRLMAMPDSMSAPTTPFVPNTPPNPGVFGTIANIFRTRSITSVARSTSGPMLSMLPIISKLPVLLLSRRKLVSEDNPIRWEGDPSTYQATSVAGGHILEWRVQWRSNGYSLGNVAHTLTLAPRQARRIAMLNWRRKEEAARREITESRDVIEQSTSRTRDYSDAVQSSLSEWSKGGSKSKTTGAAGGVGFAMGPVVIGGGVAHGRSSSSSWQQGGRNVAASEQQSLRDAIRQHGESLRRLESTVVTEVTQEEEIEGISEVIRNANYCHSLTVIYHEILRHLRVDTVLSGVRECLFVPFSISDFDGPRALKWRDLIRRGILKRSLRWALSYIDDVIDDFRNSSIPEGRRDEQPIKYISGSVYIQMGIERPEDPVEDEINESIWHPFGWLLPQPARHIINNILAIEKSRRDRYFQKEVAPTMASRWVDKLILTAGDEVLEGVDFTLASSYSYNKTVRVDFTCRPSGNGVNRSKLEHLKVSINSEDPDVNVDLPKGSVANVKRATIHYYTEHFDRIVESDRGTRDLVDISTGKGDPDGAILCFPLSAWEIEDMQQVIREGVKRLITHLNEHKVYYHKVIWWHMDRDEIYMLLDGFKVPNGDGRSIASVVERRPMAILGNTLVFRVASGAFLKIDDHESPDMLRRYYLDPKNQQRTEPIRVSLPTEGLYAQAIMDECEACEEHMGSTDWVLNDKDPELEDLLPAAFAQRRAEAQGLSPTEFQAPIINLQNAPQAPEPTGLEGVLGAVTKGDSFRDMAGLAGTQANARAAMETAASLATEFGSKAVDLRKAELGTKNAHQKLAAIKKAKDEKLIEDNKAKNITEAVLKDMNVGDSQENLTQEPVIQRAIQNAAGTPGMPISVRRGGEQVSVGGEATPVLASASGTDVVRIPITELSSAVDRAKALVEDLKFRHPIHTESLTGGWKVTVGEFAASLQRLLGHAEKLRQGSHNLCGPAAFLHGVLDRAPDVLAKFAIDLFETQSACMGSLSVDPDSDLVNTAFNPSWGIGIGAVSDWLMMSSLRDSANLFLDYEGRESEDVSGITLPGDIETWMKKCGLYSDVQNDTNLVAHKDLNHAKKSIPAVDSDKYDVSLLVDARFIGGNVLEWTPNHPNHWICLKKIHDQPGDKVEFKYFTWNSIHTRIVDKAEFENHYYGFVRGKFQSTSAHLISC